MKIKRIIASDMREAMRQVRQLFGDEAVILSNRACQEGVELVAAIDFDEQAVRLSAGRQSPHRVAGFQERPVTRDVSGKSGMTSADPARSTPASFQTTAENLAAREQAAVAPAQSIQNASSPSAAGMPRSEIPNQSAFDEVLAELNAEPVNTRPDRMASAKPGTTPARDDAGNRWSKNWPDRPASGDVLGDLQQEIGQLRELFERQLSVLEWHRYSAAHPVELETRERLHSLGLPPKLARSLAENAARNEPERALASALRDLGGRISIPETDIVRSGGIYAFVGPTGVGKTTTLAKLAAQAVLAHGRDSIALITTDRFRIGAQEQLRNYARILNIPLHVARDELHLAELLPAVSERHLVLIDTAGMSPRDFQMMDLLKKMPAIDRRLKLLLVLSAQAQYSAMQDAITRFQAVPLAGMILTKLDETLLLGSALGALVQSGLPLCCTGVGQRVPEDIWFPSASDLIKQAIELGQSAPDDSEPEYSSTLKKRA
ncbi:flagellar biosynthesis protein FlhF [Halothiobacillus sp.]|uniref:flagellar biosynthesis protein FlhF n=1 Tax=Halothiobacillus sp. TaxID=1891311 RepID=UPI002AD203A8|nr:flagellar biosynthesis protein FlhF [Halothiobacillus sp.]